MAQRVVQDTDDKHLEQLAQAVVRLCGVIDELESKLQRVEQISNQANANAAAALNRR